MSNKHGLRAPAFASLALTFAGLGDAFLYPFLPINHLSVGLPVMWVGVMLSINRFVRIFSNGVMVRLFSHYGLRTVMITAVWLAIFSTIGYAVAPGVIAWTFFRICWGLSFSAMRIGTLGYALQSEKQGISLGISRSLQELGPMLALFIAPLLMNMPDATSIFTILSVMSLPALYFAMKLPDGEDRTPATVSKAFLQFPSVFNAITLVSAILIDGIVVVVLGVLFVHYGNDVTPVIATTLAAFYLGYRRVCLVMLSPAGGWLSDRIGIDKVFNVSIAMTIAGLFLLISGWVAAGAIIVFTFYSILSAITPGSVARDQSHALAAVAENATWRDIGAAVGTLLGGILITSPYLVHALSLAIPVLLILLLVHLGTAQRVLKFFFLNR